MAIPEDRDAEAWLAGVCVASNAGYRRAAERVRPEAFYTPAYRSLVEACSHMQDLAGVDEDTVEQRIARAAELAGVEVGTVRRLVEDRPLQWDRNGRLAVRIQRAADARWAMQLAGDLRKRLGDGEPLEKVVAELASDLQTLLHRAAA